MSTPAIPAELLDRIVGFLHDSEDALKSCCLVSKSWVPRTREHLFARVKFHRYAASLQSWKNTFPDPSTSPACYTKTLSIGSPHFVTAEEGGWIRTFSRIVRLEFNVHEFIPPSDISLILFRGISPTLKSLHISSGRLLPQTFDLVYSLPLLEDLAVFVRSAGVNDGVRCFEQPDAIKPRSSPAFTGTLSLVIQSGMNIVIDLLLALPGDLPFRNMMLLGDFEDVSSSAAVTALVGKCCDTLEGIALYGPMSVPVELSKATKLKDIDLKVRQDPRWIISALKTITHDHQNLREVSILTTYVSSTSRSVGPDQLLQGVNEAWLELDKLLVQLWESHRIHVKVKYHMEASTDREEARTRMEGLLPELTTRGIVDLAGM